MQVIRFMGEQELAKFINGEVLVNDTNWACEGKASESIGFCFFPTRGRSVEFFYKFLAGIVDTSFAVIFDMDDTILNESSGRYTLYGADGETFLGVCVRTEYSTESYSQENASIVSINKRVDYGKYQQISESEFSTALA